MARLPRGARCLPRTGRGGGAHRLQPDGLNINQGVGATAPAALVKAVAEHQADYGIALDGDADRLQMVDAQGRLYNGDELLYVMAADRLASARRCRAWSAR
jgi:phosphomannomutase